MLIAFKLTVLILVICLGLSIHVIIQGKLKLEKMKKLLVTGEKITSNIKYKPLMEEIIETVKKETASEACSLYLLDNEKKELWFEIANGEKGYLIKEIRLKLGDGIAGWVAKEGTALNLADVNLDPRFRKDIGDSIGFKQKAMLTMPIKFKNETIGVIQAINKVGGGRFDKNDEELIGGMSNQIAIALENARLYKEMHELFVDSINSLADAVDFKDPYTNGHSRRVTLYSLKIGKEMGLSDDSLELLEYMAVLHDVGKLGIEDNILKKPGILNDEEYTIMKSHTVVGAKILNSMKNLRRLIPGARYHHERFDGSGYTDGLKGSEIPLEARIISVADAYDAMVTDRPYRKAFDENEALEEINRCAGKQFDPEVVNCFNTLIKREKLIKDNKS